MKRSKQRWRRIVAGIGLVLAAVGLASSSLSSRAGDVEIVVSVPASTTQVELQLLARNQTERLAFFRGSPDGGGELRWPITIQHGDYDVTATLELKDGVSDVQRAVTIAGDGVIRIDLTTAAAP